MNCTDSKDGSLLCNPHPDRGNFFILGKQGNSAYRLRGGLPAPQLFGAGHPEDEDQEGAEDEEKEPGRSCRGQGGGAKGAGEGVPTAQSWCGVHQTKQVMRKQ